MFRHYIVPTTHLKASRQAHRSRELYSNEKNGLQQIQMENCQPIKTLKNKKKKKGDVFGDTIKANSHMPCRAHAVPR
jgi:hypothetical protein